MTGTVDRPGDGEKPLLVCVCHIWWDFVWQRPQHLMSRLAQHHDVLYVEEPHIEIGPDHEGFEVVERVPGVEVAQLTYRGDHDTFWRWIDETRDPSGGHPFAVSKEIRSASLMFQSFAQPRLEQEVVEEVRRRRRSRPVVLWLYTPIVVGFVELLHPDLVVYDVMDELTAFRHAPQALREREAELLSRADVVLGGGPSLYESKRDRHPDVYLFPSGVDQEHFAQALDPTLAVPDALAVLSRPVVGFYGVIDERTDLALLAAAADARPDWSWVMIGPFIKIELDALPRRPNLHYLGKQEYATLPALLKGFDVAMMPFALNESTRFISPTKTLEYMAAHKPIVSTPIPDVISLYGSVVRFADDAEAFVIQVEAALAESEEEKAARARREDEFLGRYSWGAIASEIHSLISDRLAAKSRR